MAEPDAEDVAATEVEGGDLEQLAQAAARAVPARVPSQLTTLLGDRVLEVPHASSSRNGPSAFCI